MNPSKIDQVGLQKNDNSELSLVDTKRKAKDSFTEVVDSEDADTLLAGILKPSRFERHMQRMTGKSLTDLVYQAVLNDSSEGHTHAKGVTDDTVAALRKDFCGIWYY